MTRFNRPDDGAALTAAMMLVEKEGLRGLSLRPLAEQLGTTVSALTHRFGLKDALTETLITAAMAQDGMFFDRWLARIRALDVRSGALMADIANEVLSDLAGSEALRSRFYCELLQGVASRPEIAPSLGAWSDVRLSFWRAATEHVAMPELGEILHAFSISEGPYGLALGDLAAYRWMRRLNLGRLCCGLVSPAASDELRQFAVFRSAMGEPLEDPARQEAVVTEWQAEVAGFISALIIAEGADAVTHRAIAARAGLANSTLAYHFPRQEDLLRAGINDVAAKVRRATAPKPEDDAPGFDLTAIESARATFAIALVATRMPGLKAIVADLRRRRGENLVGRLERETGAGVFDVVSSQAMSLTGMGQHVLDAVTSVDGPSAGVALTARMRERVAKSAHM